MLEDTNKDRKVQYYLVDHSLRMRRGKTCAQCAHGALYAQKLADSMIQHPPSGMSLSDTMDYSRKYSDWFYDNMTKIVLKAGPEDLERALKEFPIASEVVDSGKTEIPGGTRTVVVLPIMDKDEAPEWVKTLPLL